MVGLGILLGLAFEEEGVVDGDIEGIVALCEHSDGVTSRKKASKVSNVFQDDGKKTLPSNEDIECFVPKAEKSRRQLIVERGFVAPHSKEVVNAFQLPGLMAGSHPIKPIGQIGRVNMPINCLARSFQPVEVGNGNRSLKENGRSGAHGDGERSVG